MSTRPTAAQPNLRVTLTEGGATREGVFPAGTRVEIALRGLRSPDADAPLGALSGGRCLALNERLTADIALSPITYQHDEGRRIYERSLRFLFLLAAHNLFPGARVRVQHSLGYGVFLKIKDHDLLRAQVDALEMEMRRLARLDLPFDFEVWTREQAIAWFAAEDQPDTARLLRFRPKDTMPMYGCGGVHDYFYGAMLPSTGYTRVFSLREHFPGAVLQYPAPNDPLRPAPYIRRPKHLRVFAESQRWCEVLRATNLADLNDLVLSGGIHNFIRVNEALHEGAIARIAAEIAARGARVVLVFGPSSSGKTTFANRLMVHLQVHGLRPALVSMDDFYRDRDSIPLGEDGLPDLEAIDALDVACLSACVERLLSGETVDIPRFDFARGRRADAAEPLRLADGSPLLIEGIHGMNDLVTDALPEHMLYGVYVSALSCVNMDDHNRVRTTDVRLLRRIVRDVSFRGTPPEATIAMWPKVRAGEEKWIFPHQEKADATFNSALHYELPLLKARAYDLLLRVPETDPAYLVARRLLKVLHYVQPVSESVLREVPPLSILREFIGECTFYDRH